MRPLDRNEIRYVALRWRELRIVNRILTIGAVVISLLALGAAGVSLLLVSKGGAGNALVGLFACVMMLGVAGMYGFILFVRGRVWGAEPAPSLAATIEGPFWEKASARTMTRHGIGDTDLSLPPHWLPLLRRAGSSRLLTAEVVGGPAETSILLSVNGVLSVSDDVAHGLMAVQDPLLPVFALLAVIGFLVAALVAGASYDADLTLRRHLKVGSEMATFSSVAALERTPPVAFGRVRLTGVTVARGGPKTVVAVDAPPPEVGEAARLTGEAERLRHEIESNPCAETRSDGSGEADERHAEAMARAAAKLLDEAVDWAQRLEAAPRSGFVVRGARGLVPELAEPRADLQAMRHQLGDEAERGKRRRARVAEGSAEVLSLVPAGRSRVDIRAMAEEAGRKVMSHDEETALAELLANARYRIADTADRVAARHTLEGIFYRRSSGQGSAGTWLAVGADYSTFALRAQAATVALGLLSALLILLSLPAAAHRKKILSALAARLPRSL